MSGRCGSCHHWGRAMRSGDVGECRGGPPVTVDQARLGVWPLTERTDFCGVYSPAVRSPDPAPSLVDDE